VIEFLEDDGHEVEKISFPFLNYSLPTYYILTTAEASSNLSRYDGVKYGYRSPNTMDMESMYKKSRSEGFGEEVKRRILLGTFVLSASYYDAYYTKAQKVRQLIRKQTLEIFKNFDFIILPTTPTTAFKLGEVKNPLDMYFADLLTVQASVAGNPAISIPISRDDQGLPVGFQIMADNFEEEKLLGFANYLLSSFALIISYERPVKTFLFFAWATLVPVTFVVGSDEISTDTSSYEFYYYPNYEYEYIPDATYDEVQDRIASIRRVRSIKLQHHCKSFH
jgi:Asp-tRNA(Asn)/Glu-tRNA(Gln) amidotransferase A subunit family amidase